MKIRFKTLGQAAALGALIFAFSGITANAEDIVGDVYPLATCPVSGEALGSMGDPYMVNHEGRDVRLCCAGCEKRFTSDPAKYLAKIDEAIIAQQSEKYPLETCAVAGQPLGDMGDVINYVHNNRLVKFCCSGCEKKFEADPAAFIAKLDEAVIAQQSAAYPFDVCLVTGEKLTGNSDKEVDLVVGNQLVKLCCAGCEKKFNKHPAKYLGMIESGKIDMSETEGSDHK